MAQGEHLKAVCAYCGRFYKFLSKKDVDQLTASKKALQDARSTNPKDNILPANLITEALVIISNFMSGIDSSHPCVESLTAKITEIKKMINY